MISSASGLVYEQSMSSFLDVGDGFSNDEEEEDGSSSFTASVDGGKDWSIQTGYLKLAQFYEKEFKGLNSGVGHTHGVLLISSICAVSPAAAVVANAVLGYTKDWK